MIAQLSPHQHSGRRLPRHHTSYSALLFLLLLVTALVASFTFTAAGSQLVSVVQGPPPSQSAVITLPLQGQTLTTSPATVTGSCPAGLFVNISDNDSTVGATNCDNQGLFTLSVALVEGSNQLVAQDYDALFQQGPASPTITVTYQSVASPPSPATPTQTPVPTHTTTPVSRLAPLRLSSQRLTSLNATAGQPLTLTATVQGAVQPVSAHWSWGDAQTSAAEATSDTTYSGTHTYQQGGTYHPQFQIVDAKGRLSLLTFLVVVANQAVSPAVTTTPNPPAVSRGLNFTPSLAIAWPLLGLSFLMVLSFYLGERDQRQRLKEVLQ